MSFFFQITSLILVDSDLKAENVLVANDLSIRLMDFGLSKLVEQSKGANMTTGIG